MYLSTIAAVGTISGKQHIMTFDGRHYDLAGLCSYMLATDLVNNTFSVILRYEGNLKELKPQSIVVMVDGRTIEISSSYMVRRKSWQTLEDFRCFLVLQWFK